MPCTRFPRATAALALPVLLGAGLVGTAHAAPAPAAARAACAAGSTIYDFTVTKRQVITHVKAWRVKKGQVDATFEDPIPLVKVVTARVAGTANGITASRVMTAAQRAVQKKYDNPYWTLSKPGAKTPSGPAGIGESTTLDGKAKRDYNYAMFEDKRVFSGAWSAQTCGKSGVTASGKWSSWQPVSLGGEADCDLAKQSHAYLQRACDLAYPG